MASKVEICNKALQKLGDYTIVSLLDDTEQARSINLIYDSILEEVLRRHYWNFALKRAQLPSDVPVPVWGYSTQYTLPSDCLRVVRIRNDPQYAVEGRKILTNSGAPLELLYIRNEVDPTLYDSTFVEMLSTRLAAEICERITNNGNKKITLLQEFEAALDEAKKIDAVEDPPVILETDTWLIVRL